MTEKELLKKAAKATNRKRHPIIADAWSGDGFELMRDASMSIRVPTVWNPLDDDGDAIRLAVKLRISLIHEQEYMGGPVLETVEAITAPISGDGKRTCTTECINEQGCDEMARVRLAITRAAAAMAEKE